MKKIITVAIVVLLMVSAIVPASACSNPDNDLQTRPVNKTDFETEYPYVFVHGMGGWGPSNKFYKLSHCFPKGLKFICIWGVHLFYRMGLPGVYIWVNRFLLDVVKLEVKC